MNRYAGGLLVLLLLILSGCGGQPRPGDEEMSRELPAGYELAWIEPQIILSDTLVTLIRADRIDTIKVAPGNPFSPRASSIEFTIDDMVCDVVINLLDDNRDFIRPLLIQQLPVGTYRLTLNPWRPNAPTLTPGEYLLRAEYCGRVRLVGFVHGLK